MVNDPFGNKNILNTFFDFGFKIESEIEDYFSTFTSSTNSSLSTSNLNNSTKAIFLRKKY